MANKQELLVDTNLIKDEQVKQGVRDYAVKKKDNPETIPQFRSFEPPVVNNARIYLLTGNKAKEDLFTSYKNELSEVGFRVLGTKYLIDEGRPDYEEVRYFFPQDRAQAEKIAEVVKFKLSIDNLPVNLHSDADVNPGYIEIWFGK